MPPGFNPRKYPQNRSKPLSRVDMRCKIEPIIGVPDVFDFPRDIQPIRNTLCTDRSQRHPAPEENAAALDRERHRLSRHLCCGTEVLAILLV